MYHRKDRNGKESSGSNEPVRKAESHEPGKGPEPMVGLFIALLLTPVAAKPADDSLQKALPLPGETFLVQGREAFVILPQVQPAQ